MREFFTRLRNSVRSFLQRLQRRATAKAGGSQAVPATPGIPASHPSHGMLLQPCLGHVDLRPSKWSRVLLVIKTVYEH